MKPLRSGKELVRLVEGLHCLDCDVIYPQSPTYLKCPKCNELTLVSTPTPVNKLLSSYQCSVLVEDRRNRIKDLIKEINKTSKIVEKYSRFAKYLEEEYEDDGQRAYLDLLLTELDWVSP